MGRPFAKGRPIFFSSRTRPLAAPAARRGFTKRLWRAWPIFLLLSFFVAPPAAPAQSGGHTLQGKVVTPGGSAPTHPVKVTLTFNGRRIYETFTDLSGSFTFSGLSRGTYQLTAEGDDNTFETTSVHADVAAFGASSQSFTQLLMRQKKYAVAVAVFAEAARLNPTNAVNPLMRATALIHQAPAVEPSAASDREFLLGKVEAALNQASELSNGKLTADHLSLAMFYDMKGERARAADELEQYLRKNPDAKNADAIREAMKKLREPAGQN